MTALIVPVQGAQAYTECLKTVSKVYSGDDGKLWIDFTQGGAAIMLAADPDKEATLALAMTALVGGRNVVARYTSNSADCAALNGDLEGFWLL